MIIHVVREDCTDRGTVGKVFVDGVFLWWSLEDRLHDGPKIPGDTCIPAGRYQVVIDQSARFGRRLPRLLNVPNFTGVRIHPGNSTGDTAGCLLVGGGYQPKTFTLVHSKQACDHLQGAIQQALDRGESVWCEIVDPIKVPRQFPQVFRA